MTVKGLPCGEFEVVASFSAEQKAFPRLNAQYRQGGMHDVTGSSPVRSSTKSRPPIGDLLFVIFPLDL